MVDSRSTKEREAIRRRRECMKCSRRYTTYEQIEHSMPLIKKKDGRWEAFDRNKLMSGLLKACQKRPVGQSSLESITDEIEKECFNRNGREITSQEIGALVMQRLHGLDEVAYVRFASVYRQFKDVTEFMEEVQRLLRNNENHRASPNPTPSPAAETSKDAAS